MKKLILLAIALILGLSLLTGCHNTGRQVRKTIEALHDLVFEGSA